MNTNFDINKEKIDLVYTWVDSSDANWQKKKADFEVSNGLEPDKLINRYRCNDELKYSLRSVEKYAPWVNHIYIITDNQIPDWLNADNPKVTIVDHKEIIPAEALPTYNSIAIEMCIDNIPNLSEYFLYSNDDCYFADYVESLFFYKKDGYPICRFRKKIKDPSKNYKSWVENSQKLIKNKFNKKFTDYPHHGIDAYRKSDIKKCKDIFNDKIKEIISHHFRDVADCERVLYLYYACAIKHGHYKRISRIDSDLPFFTKIKNFITKNYCKDTVKMYSSSKKIEQTIKKYKPKLLCINDSCNTTNEDIERTRQILEKFFPDKSCFER